MNDWRATATSPPMPDPTPPPKTPRWFRRLCLFAVLAFGAFIGRELTIAAGGSDSSGYLNSARLLASGRIAMETRVPPALTGVEAFFRPHFQPLGFRATAEDVRLSPTYPTGLPLHLALFCTVFGWTWGPWLLEWLTGMVTVVLVYRLGRLLGLHWISAAAASVMLGACPILLFTVIQPLSDTLATTWCTGAVIAALKSRHTGKKSWAAACGAAFGMCVLVRPTNAVLAPALLTLLGLNWRMLLSATLAGLPFAAWLAAYNHFNYGSALRSGYYPIATAFSAAAGWPTALHFLRWLALFLPAIVLVLPLGALRRRASGHRELLALGLWFWAITGLYLFYDVSRDSWGALRFVLPALPALVLAAMLGLETLLCLKPGLHQRALFGAAAGLMLWSIVGSWYWARKSGYLYTKQSEDAYTAATLALRDQSPPGTLVVCSQCSGAVYYYTSFAVLRWDYVNAADFGRYTQAAQHAGIPIRALLFDFEEPGALRERCPGKWKLVRQLNNLHIWELEAPAG